MGECNTILSAYTMYIGTYISVAPMYRHLRIQTIVLHSPFIIESHAHVD